MKDSIQLPPLVDLKLRRPPSSIERQNSLFVFSALVFRVGLALVTFEQDRFFDIQLSDYLFFLSLSLLVFSPKFHWLKSIRSGISLGGALILSGALLSAITASSMSEAAGPFARLLVLFGLFAPLAMIHSRDIRTNMIFVLVGISANSAIALIQAWMLPEIVDMLSVNPTRDTGLGMGSFLGRFQGLTSHPNVLGLSVALAVLIGVGLLSSEARGGARLGLALLVGVCSLAGIVSGSRTLLASLLPALLVLALVQKRNFRSVLRTLAAIVVMGGTIAYLAPAATSLYTDRLFSSGENFVPDYGRVMAATLALAEISQKPISGWGVEHMGEAGTMLIPQTTEVGIAHNTLLQYWYGMGLLGAIGFLALFFVPVMRMLRALKMKSLNGSTDALGLGLASYVLFFIVCNVQPIFYNRFMYVPMFVFAGFAAHLLGPTKGGERAHAPVVHLPVQTSSRHPERAEECIKSPKAGITERIWPCRV